MRLNLFIFCIASVLFCASGCSNGKKGTVIIESSIGKTDTIAAEPIFDIVTNEGTIRIKLYEDTPMHRNNFAKLALSGFYDGLLFHRVIKNMMIQTGDPDSRNATAETPIGAKDAGYKIDSEIISYHKHKHGAIGGVQDGNAQHRSSGSQFYIIQNENGVPSLNGKYTVFGEVISGLDVVDKIGNTPLAKYNRPQEDIRIEKVVMVKE